MSQQEEKQVPKGQPKPHRKPTKEEQQQRYQLLHLLEVFSNPPSQFLRPDEAAAILNISARTIDRLVKAGQLPVYYIGSQYRISPFDLVRYISDQRVPTPDQGLTEHCLPVCTPRWKRQEVPSAAPGEEQE